MPIKINSIMFRIKEVAKAKGVKLSEIAEKMGISPVSFSNSINGNPTIQTLLKISEILDCDIRDLIAPTKENNAQPLYIENNGTFDIIGYIDTGKLK